MEVAPKRYFVVDYQAAVMSILPSKDSKEVDRFKYVMFRDILDVYIPKKNRTTPKDFPFPMYL